MDKNMEIRKIKEIEELEEIEKVKFIPDLYKFYNIETFISKYFVSDEVFKQKDLTEDEKDEIMKEFETLYRILFDIYVFDKKQYFTVMETIKNRMELSDDFFKKLRREITLDLKRRIKECIETQGEFFFEVWRMEERRRLLSTVYNVDETAKQFKKLVEITFEKGIVEFLKKENHHLRSLGNIFLLIYNEREWHYNLLEEILKYELFVPFKEVRFFKQEIKKMGEKLMANFTDMDKAYIINDGKEKNIFSFKDFEPKIILEPEMNWQAEVEKNCKNFGICIYSTIWLKYIINTIKSCNFNRFKV